MQPGTNQSKIWFAWVGGAALVGLVALSVIAATGPLARQPDSTPREPSAAPLQETSGQDPVEFSEITDTTEPLTAANSEQALSVTDVTEPWAEEDSIAELAVTDTTLPVVPEPAVTVPTVTDNSEMVVEESPSTTTTARVMSSIVFDLDKPGPPRVDSPTWDDRLPGTWDGLPDTECGTALGLADSIDDPFFYLFWLWRDANYGRAESEVIHRAFLDPSFEPEPVPGTRLYDALASLGVSSAQHIRTIGELAAEVRWYAWYVKERITIYDGLDDPECAAMLQGVEAVLTAPITNTDS